MPMGLTTPRVFPCFYEPGGRMRFITSEQNQYIYRNGLRNFPESFEIDTWPVSGSPDDSGDRFELYIRWNPRNRNRIGPREDVVEAVESGYSCSSGLGRRHGLGGQCHGDVPCWLIVYPHHANNVPDNVQGIIRARNVLVAIRGGECEQD